MIIFPRRITSLLVRRLRHRPVVVLTGSRQAGKTTLVRHLFPALGEEEPVYFTLDDPDERLRLAADPVRRLDHHQRLVVLDEIQKQPILLDAVKLLADRGRRFLLLGSSQILLLRQVRETLAGRASLLELWPLALCERVETAEASPSVLDTLWQEGERVLQHLSSSPPTAEEARTWRARAEVHLLWGGYPALDHLPPSERAPWLRDFRRTYLERDLADLGRVADLDEFALAQNLLAARTAQLFNASEVARELGVAVNTVRRYLRFLEISYQTYLLRPAAPTATARLIKSPKLYWTDPALAALLAGKLGILDGPIYETAVLDELLRWSSWQEEPPELHFYRTRAGREVDFVLTGPDRLLLLEAKMSEQAHPVDARPLAETLTALGSGVRGPAPRLPVSGENGSGPDRYPPWRLGIIVTRGREVRPLLPSVWEVPFWLLFGALNPSA